MSQLAKTIEIIDTKRKPPKLKASDRTISVMLENNGQQKLSPMEQLPTHSSVIYVQNLVKQKSADDYHSAPIFFTHQSQSGTDNLYQQSHSTTSLQPTVKKQYLRRCDTFDTGTPSLYYVKKTQSLHSNELIDGLISKQKVDCMYLSDSNTMPFDIEMDGENVKDVTHMRRNSHMNRSFNDSHNQRRPISRHASMQYYSYNEDIHANPNTDTSLESESYRNLSISNNKNLEVAISTKNNRITIQQQPQEHLRNPLRQYNRQSSFSLDHPQQHQIYNSRRSLRLPSSKPYLMNTSPVHFDHNLIEECKSKTQQIQKQQSIAIPNQSSIYNAKKTCSLRYKQKKTDRDNFRTKKSKSFLVELETKDDETERTMSNLFSSSRNLKRSDCSLSSHENFSQIHHDIDIRKLSTSNKTFDETMTSGSIDLLKPTKISPTPFIDVDDLENIEYDLILKPHREGRNRTKAYSSRRNRKSQHQKQNKGSNRNDTNNSAKKRKRAVCFICVIFIGLMIFSVLAVVITLTHSTSSLVQNQTKQIYTFARGSPIHYNGN